MRWGAINETLIHVDELQILGVHNYENVMAAAAMGICAGIALDTIRCSYANQHQMLHSPVQVSLNIQ